MAEIPKPIQPKDGYFDGYAELLRLLGLRSGRRCGMDREVVIEGKTLTDQQLENFIKGKSINEDKPQGPVPLK